MRAKLFLSLAPILGLAFPLFAQSPNLPDSAALSRLNLKTEWAISLPLLGKQDTVSMVQVLDADQFVMQSKSGHVAMMDSRTGAKQWSYQLPGAYANVYPIGFNDTSIFVLNVTRLFGFDRFTGMMEFDLELPAPPTMGPFADRDFVYVTTNGNKLSCYRLMISPQSGGKGSSEKLNLASQIAGRAGGMPMAAPPPPQKPSAMPDAQAGTYANPNQKTPSVAALPSVTPPYSLAKREMASTPSVSVLPSVKQPYEFRPPNLQFNQITPSVAVIPPSIYRVHQLANFRPKPPVPPLVWSIYVPQRIGSVPVRVVAYPTGANKPVAANWYPDRIWILSEGMSALAVSGNNGSEQVAIKLRDTITTPMAGPMVFDRTGTNKFARPEDLTALGFVGLTDGTFVALDLGAGGRESQAAGRARTEWKANLGSPATHKPLLAKEAVFASGENSGVTKLNALTGDELWETESVADRILAVNEEYAYIMDRAGALRIYDNKMTASGKGAIPPLAKIELPGFNVPVTNDQNDRVFLVAESGMMVCVRDAAGKYNRPFTVSPPNPQQYAPKPAPAAAPMN